MELVTLDGYDGTVLACPTIALWYDWEDRAKRSPETGLPVVATVSHGVQVTLIEKDGPACLVEVEAEDGQTARGWVTFWFVRELKGKWQAERLGAQVAD